MKSKKMLAAIMAVLMIALLAPSLALAASVTLNLSVNTASPGDSVTASGTADPDTWVTIKGIDSAQNIVQFGGVKSDSQGNYSDTFGVPDTTGAWTIVAGYGSNVANKTLTITNGSEPGGSPVIQSVSAVNGAVTVILSAAPAAAPAIADFTVTRSINSGAAAAVAPTAISANGATVTLTVPAVAATTSSQSVVIRVSYQGGAAVAATAFTVAASSTSPGGGGGGGGGASSSYVTSTTGSSAVTPSAGGAISLGSKASIKIPAGALQGTRGLTVTVKEVSSPPAPPEGYAVIGAYSFTVGGQESYTFNKPVTLTFTFDPASIPEGWTPAVYYYNGAEWVLLTGTVSGNTITVTLDHFTTFAVLAREAGEEEEEEAPPSAPPPAFSDVPASHWAFDVITELSSRSIISGYPDGAFKPNNTITRAEFVTIINKALDLPAYSPAAPSFTDAAPDAWYYASVESAVYAGIIEGYGSAFGPGDPVTREQMAVIIARAAHIETGDTALTFTDSDQVSDWAREGLAGVVRQGIMQGYPDGSFGPLKNATRAEAAAVIAGILKPEAS